MGTLHICVRLASASECGEIIEIVGILLYHISIYIIISYYLLYK